MKHTHIIGKGSQTGIEVKAKQWYTLFGFIQLNQVNINDMSGEASDFVIITKGSWLNIFLLAVVRFRHVIVVK